MCAFILTTDYSFLRYARLSTKPIGLICSFLPEMQNLSYSFLFTYLRDKGENHTYFLKFLLEVYGKNPDNFFIFYCCLT